MLMVLERAARRPQHAQLLRLLVRLAVVVIAVAGACEVRFPGGLLVERNGKWN